MKEAIKYDVGKRLWHLLPWDALEATSFILEHGKEKYGARNWENGFDYSRIFNSLQRHLIAWWNGEDNDPETGCSHLAHAVCNALFLLTFSIRNKGTDDRPKSTQTVSRSVEIPPKRPSEIDWSILKSPSER